MALVAVGAIGADAMAATSAPLERAAQAVGVPGIVGLVGLGATTAMLGVLLSQILGISRMIFAMARRHDLPRALAHIHPTAGVPDSGVVLTGLVILLFALFGTLAEIIAAAAFTILLYYAITNPATLRLAREHRLYPTGVPVLGLVACLLLAFSLRPVTILAGLGLLAAGLIVRTVMRLV